MSAPARPQTRPVDQTMLQLSTRQHIVAADKLAARIANCASAVRKSLADGLPAAPAARQIGYDLMELMAEIGRLAEDGQFARLTKGSAALRPGPLRLGPSRHIGNIAHVPADETADQR